MEIEQNKISIIVPIYNAETTLDRCVSSLVGQTYQNIEIILVNDGSVDDSLSICRRFAEADDRVKVIDKHNGGVSSARNAGLDVANGEFVMFCDSDDWAEPDWCEVLYNLYQPDYLPMCGYLCHYKNGKEETVACEAEIFKIPQEDFFLWKGYGTYVPWNKFFSLTVIRENNLRFPVGIALGEDELFVWRYLQSIKGDILITNRVLNHYSWPEGNSLTKNVPANYYEQQHFLFCEIYNDITNGAPCSLVARQCFYEDSYWQYQKGIRRVFQNNSISKYDRICIGNRIMKSEEYQLLSKKVDTTQNNLVKYACKRKNCLVLYLIYLIGKC